jgi:uroporphyrinogen decarboxylase
VPSIVFTKGGGLWLESIAAIGCDAVGLDWTMDIGRARRLVGDKVALQGNLDPAASAGRGAGEQQQAALRSP